MPQNSIHSKPTAVSIAHEVMEASSGLMEAAVERACVTACGPTVSALPSIRMHGCTRCTAQAQVGACDGAA